MRKETIGIIIFCIILAGILFYIYYTYEGKSDIVFVNVSISAEDGKDRIETGFIIQTEQGIIEGNTSSMYELLQIPEGKITIKNINLENQDYYQNERRLDITGNIRIDLQLENPELPEVSVDGKNPLIVKVSSHNFQEIIFCLKGSMNYLFIETNFTEITKIENFTHYDRCYDSGFSLKDSEEIIEVTYTQMSEPLETDYINISLIDKEGNYKIVKLI